MHELIKRARTLLLRFRRVVSIGGQLALVCVSNWTSFLLRFDGAPPEWAIASFWELLPVLVAIRAITFIPFRLYEGLWRYASTYDLRALLGGVATSTVLFYFFVALWHKAPMYPRSIFIIDAVLLVFMLGGLRLMRRLYAEVEHRGPCKRVLIFGAGDAGELIVRDMRANKNTLHGYEPIGFLDDDRKKLGLRIHGVPVLGTRDDLPSILKTRHPDEVLIALPDADPSTIRPIVRAFEPYKIPIKTLPNLRDVMDGKIGVGHIRNLAVEDLLTRAPVGLDPRPLRMLISGRRVMVTGAGGSIGSELCRQIARLHPAALVMLDRYENSLHAIRLELEDERRAHALHPVVADVTDAARIDQTLSEYRPEIIFHAAAYKHVPLMEENPCEAIKNNVGGTRVLAQAAERHGVDRFILISTDKAVNPACVMGASKRVAELIVLAQAAGSGTSFSTVRFGNVLGSNGSVLPRFLEQIRKGGPVTITHPDMRRFFMLIPEAVRLVLHAASHADGGVTYVLDMGEQVRVLDMARDLIRLAGLVPDEDIKIEFIGLRRGEKIQEELIGLEEEAGPSTVQKILRVRSRRRPPSDLLEQVALLEGSAAEGRVDAMLRTLQLLVAPFSAKELPAPLESQTRAQAPVPWVVQVEHPCPKCKTGTVRRSHVRSLSDRIRRELTPERPFRCVDCGWRGWMLPPMASHDNGSLLEAPVPDLTSLDTEITAWPKARVTFAPRDLA